MSNSIKIQIASWTFEAEEGESGDLLLTVFHPVNGESRSIDINVDRQLGVIHDSHWTLDDRLHEEALIMEWAADSARAEGVEAVNAAVILASNDATAAQHMLRRLQGYEYEGRVPFGQLPYWRRNGVVCSAPGPVHHAMAYTIVRDTLNPSKD